MRRVHPEYGQIVGLAYAEALCRDFTAVGKPDHELFASGDHVVVRNDVTVSIDEESRTPEWNVQLNVAESPDRFDFHNREDSRDLSIIEQAGANVLRPAELHGCEDAKSKAEGDRAEDYCQRPQQAQSSRAVCGLRLRLGGLLLSGIERHCLDDLAYG